MILLVKHNLGYLNFLTSLNQFAARSAQDMEDLIYSHPNSAIVKAGIFIEDIINDVFIIEEINDENFKNLASKIAFMYRNGYITKDVYESFTNVRKQRNKAAHDASNPSLTAAFLCHEEMYKIAKWYFETYGDPNVQIPLYEIPKQSRSNLADLVTGQLKEEISKVIKDVATSKLDISQEAGGFNIEQQKTTDEKSVTETKALSKVKAKETTLLDELTRLKDSSHEAIENAYHFSGFKNYLHVERQIQSDLENILLNNKSSNSNNLILLCGSVGDGKSHLLAYLKQERPELIKNYKIINDATESNLPDMDAMESLEENLRFFSDQLIDTTNEKIILAINMGVLHNFINRDHNDYKYKELRNFIDQSELFTDKIRPTYSQKNFDLISFGDYQYYELSAEGPSSDFYESLLYKIVAPSYHNPFYSAYIRDQKNNTHTVIHQNYKFLQIEIVRKQIIQLIIETIIEHKLVISARAFLNFIADIIIPSNFNNDLSNRCRTYNLKYSLPNLLFNSSERSPILRKIKESDPIHLRITEIDDLYIKMNTQDDLWQLTEEYHLNDLAKDILKPFFNIRENDDFLYHIGITTFIRTLMLTNDTFSDKLLDSTVKRYLNYVYAFNTKEINSIKKVYEKVKKTINLWQGHINWEYTFIERNQNAYQIGQKLNLKPYIKHLEKQDDNTLRSFRSTLQVIYLDKENDQYIELEIDYPLYKLLNKVEKGYLPNKNDQEDAVKFVDFIDKIMSIGQKDHEILIHSSQEKKNFLLKRGDFGGYIFERKA